MEAVLARQIKTFRKEFRRQHGRDPSRKDMAKEPEVIVAYDAWLSLKDASSSSGRASGSKSRLERSESRAKPQAPLSPHQSLSQSSNMPPPVAPVTPRKKPMGAQAAIENSTDEIRRSVHDSGGSVVDVPVTPVHRQSQQRSRQSPTASPDSPSMNALHGPSFDDATSPSKLRTLIASFSSTRGRLTPTKRHSLAGDERLAQQLEQSARAQNGNLFTPRTKARKRLRGEIVVTPVKEKPNRPPGGQLGNAYAVAESGPSSASLPSKTTAVANRPAKRQRGMGTLRDFNFVPTSNKTSQGALVPEHMQMKAGRHAEGQYAEDDADDEDEDMLGPSPSVRRIVNVQPLDGGGSFRPLFGSHVSGSLEDMDEETASVEDMDTGEASVLPSSQPAESSTAITTPAPEEEEEAPLVGSDEEAIESIRAHDRRRSNIRRFQQLDEEDEEFLFGGDTFMMMQRGDHKTLDAAQTSTRGLQGSIGDDPDGLVLDGLKIASPQGKRAERARRRLCAQNVRQLLQQVEHGTMSDLVQYVGGDGDDSNVNHGDKERIDGKAGAAAEKPIAHGNAKTARMMRGALTKAGRKALALAEQAAEQQQSVEQGQETALKPQEPRLQKLILRRGRDEDDDDDLDARLYSDDDGDEGYLQNRAASYAADEDDCWASDVGSDEYGLGDGYMDEVDVE